MCNGASVESQGRPPMMSIPDWRVRLVEKYMAQLSSDDAKKRRDAAHWLGESLEDPAIPRLIELYQNDPDASVRKAAGYALGQFKAFGMAMTEDEEFAGEIVNDVIIEGKFGRPAATGGVKATLVGLVLSLLVLAGLYFMAPAGIVGDALDGLDLAALLPAGQSSAALPTATPGTGFIAQPNFDDPLRSAILGDLRPRFARLRDDVGNLAPQLQNALVGTPLDCAAFFNNISPFELGAENAVRYPDIANFVTRMNDALAAYQTAFARYDTACFGTTPLTVEQVGPVLADLRPAIETITVLGGDLEALEGVGVPTPTVPPLIAPAAATNAASPPTAATPDAVPTPDASQALALAFNALDQVTASRGSASLLVTYWNDLTFNDQTAGCNPPYPIIPDDVELDEALLTANPLLAQGVTLLNSSLEANRIGWQVFITACRTGDRQQLTTLATTEVQTARQTLAALEAAQDILAGLR